VKGLLRRASPTQVAYFFRRKPEELMALAWYLENGSQRFYARVADTLTEKHKALFKELGDWKRNHQAALSKLTLRPRRDSRFWVSKIHHGARQHRRYHGRCTG